MRSDAPLALPLLAALGMAASPCLPHHATLTLATCGGGPPVRIPIDKEDRQFSQTACHAICQRRDLGAGGFDQEG